MGNEPGKKETTKPVEQSNSTVNVIGKLKKSQATYVFSHSLTYSYIKSFFILYIHISVLYISTHSLTSLTHTYNIITKPSTSLVTPLLASHTHTHYYTFSYMKSTFILFTHVYH